MRKQRQNSTPGDTRPGKLTKDHYRIVVMGAAAVGKTCIISRLMYEEFVSEYKATVEEFHQGCYEINGMPLTLDILDTAGSYEFPAMRKLSITTGDAFILVYSVDDESSFEEVERLREQILEIKEDKLTPIVVVGNKSDIESEKRAIRRETAETTANIDWGNGYVEVSAKEDENIFGIFRELLVQAKVHLDASPKVMKRRESLPMFSFRDKKDKPKLGKRNSCTIS